MIRLMLGRRSQGKTTLGYFVARQSPARMIFDPRGMVRSDASTVETSDPGIRDGSEDLIDGRITELVVTPAANVNARFATFCKGARAHITAHPHKPFAILIDEVRFMDIRDENLDWIMRTSNVDRVQVIFTGHRPKDIPTDIRAIADSWNLFQFTLARDIAVIEEQTSPTVARDVQRLSPRCFIEWNDQIGAARYFSDPSKWYVRLRAADADPEPAQVEQPIEPDAPIRNRLWDE